jgi:hypothetical protein
MTSQNTDLSSWDILYIKSAVCSDQYKASGTLSSSYIHLAIWEPQSFPRMQLSIHFLILCTAP